MGKKKKVKTGKIEFPTFCDYSCEYAAFSDPAAIGACRKELGVWCKCFKRYNNKNNRCFGLKS
jgi:hypothetical protein